MYFKDELGFEHESTKHLNMFCMIYISIQILPSDHLNAYIQDLLQGKVSLVQIPGVLKIT